MKLIKTFLFIFVCFFLFPNTVYSNTKINKDNINDGILEVIYSGKFDRQIKITVEKDDERYIYSILDNNAIYLPLQMGEGEYKISIAENVSINKYKILYSEKIDVSKINILNMFKKSIVLVNYNESEHAAKYYEKIFNNKKNNEMQKINALYNDIIKNYSYDEEKAKNVAKEYIPIIDEMFLSKKGICYDYAVIFAGILRRNSIPSKLVMGYAPEIKEYHAWNEIYINKKWHVIDTTYDSAMVKFGKKTTFSKDAQKFKVLKVY